MLAALERASATPQQIVEMLAARSEQVVTWDFIQRVTISGEEILIRLALPGQNGTALEQSFPATLSRRSAGRSVVMVERGTAGAADPALIRLVGRAFRWWQQLVSGERTSMSEIADREGVTRTYNSRTLPLALLSPELIEAIAQGR